MRSSHSAVTSNPHESSFGQENPAARRGGAGRLRVFLSGRVQGVGMRMTVAGLAPRFALTGWVRNRPDGRVEILAEGQRGALEEFLNAIRQVMPGYIQRLEHRWEPPSGEWSGFEITYY